MPATTAMTLLLYESNEPGMSSDLGHKEERCFSWNKSQISRYGGNISIPIIS